MKREKIITSKEYYLSSLIFEDLEKIKLWRNSQMDFLRQFKPLTSKNQEQWWNDITNDEKSVIFSIISFNDDEIIGYCGLTNIHLLYSHAEISFITKEMEPTSAKYRIIFLEVLKMLAKFAFDNLNLNRIFTETYETRTDHIKILEDFGFIKEGVMREHVFKQGKFVNCIIHSVLRKEFKD